MFRGRKRKKMEKKVKKGNKKKKEEKEENLNGFEITWNESLCYKAATSIETTTKNFTFSNNPRLGFYFSIIHNSCNFWKYFNRFLISSPSYFSSTFSFPQVEHLNFTSLFHSLDFCSLSFYPCSHFSRWLIWHIDCFPRYPLRIITRHIRNGCRKIRLLKIEIWNWFHEIKRGERNEGRENLFRSTTCFSHKFSSSNKLFSPKIKTGNKWFFTEKNSVLEKGERKEKRKIVKPKQVVIVKDTEQEERSLNEGKKWVTVSKAGCTYCTFVYINLG